MHSSRLSALKPLPEPPKQEKGNLQQAIRLLSKGISVSTTKEKNDLIQSCQELWPSIFSEYEAVANSNAEKQNEFDEIQKKFLNTQEDFSILKRNSDFFKFAKQHEEKHDRQKALDNIHELENEILTYETIPELARFELRMKKKGNISDERMTFILQDEVMKHLESLIYQLKKRMIAVEQSQESSDMICKEFGSLNGLLQKEQDLLVENEQLKKEEALYINDPMTKRRNFPEFSNHSARTILKSLMNNIEDELQIAKKYEAPKEIEEGQDIDEFCGLETNQSSRVRFFLNDFPSSYAPLKDRELNPEEALETIKQASEELKESYEKISQEIASKKPTKRSSRLQDYSDISSRVQRLTDSNTMCFDRIQSFNSSLEEYMAEIDETNSQLQTILKERKMEYMKYYELLMQYKALVDSFLEVQSIYRKDKSIVQSLLSISTEIGSHLFDSDQDYLRDLLLKEINKHVDHLKTQQESYNTCQINENTNPYGSSRSNASQASNQSQNIPSLLHNNPFHKRKRKGSRLHKTISNSSNTNSASSSAAPSEQASVVQLPVAPTNYFEHKIEAYNAMALALENAGFVYNMENQAHKSYRIVLDEILQFISSNSHQHIGFFMKYLNENISKLRLTSNMILVKEKADFALQTDPYKRSDVMMQTDEPPKKGKKH